MNNAVEWLMLAGILSTWVGIGAVIWMASSRWFQDYDKLHNPWGDD